MKKVLFINSWYPSRVAPRNGNFIQKHAEAAALYNNVYALHAISDNSIKGRYELEYRVSGNVKELVVYFRKSKMLFLSGVTRVVFGFLAYLKGYKCIRKEWGQPDIVHLNVIFPAGLLAFYLKKLWGIPFVITENWTGFLAPNQKSNLNAMRRYLTNYIGNTAAINLPVSQDLSVAMQKHGINRPSIVIPNVADVKIFENPRKELHNPFTFLHISTLYDDHKNITGILKAVQLLSNKRNDFKFLILGDGELEPHKKTAAKLNIPENTITFGGPLSTQEVAEAMKQSDCFVLFSNYENLPCVMVEAMASGLPVIATNVGGIGEHLKKEFGELIEAGDLNALVQSAEFVMDNYSLYDAEKIRKYAIDSFSYEAVGSAFDEVYIQVLGKKI